MTRTITDIVAAAVAAARKGYSWGYRYNYQWNGDLVITESIQKEGVLFINIKRGSKTSRQSLMEEVGYLVSKYDAEYPTGKWEGCLRIRI